MALLVLGASNAGAISFTLGGTWQSQDFTSADCAGARAGYPRM
jgi:hypothetical protein